MPSKFNMSIFTDRKKSKLTTPRAPTEAFTIMGPRISDPSWEDRVEALKEQWAAEKEASREMRANESPFVPATGSRIEELGIESNQQRPASPADDFSRLNRDMASLALQSQLRAATPELWETSAQSANTPTALNPCQTCNFYKSQSGLENSRVTEILDGANESKDRELEAGKSATPPIGSSTCDVCNFYKSSLDKQKKVADALIAKNKELEVDTARVAQILRYTEDLQDKDVESTARIRDLEQVVVGHEEENQDLQKDLDERDGQLGRAEEDNEELHSMVVKLTEEKMDLIEKTSKYRDEIEAKYLKEKKRWEEIEEASGMSLTQLPDQLTKALQTTGLEVPEDEGVAYYIEASVDKIIALVKEVTELKRKSEQERIISHDD